jgi:serine/threonine-protein kinase SRPK3
VSVKITRADRTDQSRELHNLRELAQKSSGNPGSKCVVQLLDELEHNGPNGYHQCLVFEVLGPTVAMEVQVMHEFRERLDTDTILKVSTQVLEAIAFMHEAGYAHGGMADHPQHLVSLDLICTDLSIRNVAFYNRRLPYLFEEELFAALEPPKIVHLKRLDGKPLGQGIPSQLVASAEWSGWPLDDDVFDDDDIRIIDLGSAFRWNLPPKKLDQAANLRAPETIFTGEFDHKQDLWCVGILVRILLPKPWRLTKYNVL